VNRIIAAKTDVVIIPVTTHGRGTIPAEKIQAERIPAEIMTTGIIPADVTDRL